jgi:hypothetical protein
LRGNKFRFISSQGNIPLICCGYYKTLQVAKPFKLIFYFVLIACFSTLAKAQIDTTYKPEHLYQSKELHADLAFLKSVLEEAHPSLYRYSLKDTINARFADADQQLNQPLTDMQFWRIAEPVVANVRSAHTAVYPSANYTKWSYKHGSRIPLSVYVFNGRLYAAWFPKDSGKLYRGARITAIDSIPGTVIIASLKSYVTPEGYSDQFVNFNVESYFVDLYSQVFGFKSEYNVAFIDSSGSIQHVILKPFKNTYKDAPVIIEQKDSDLEKSVKISYFKDVPATVVLKINQFSYLKDYRAFDVGFFKKLDKEKIKNLIIDLRGDGGGYLNIGIDMMRYLVRGFVVPSNVITAVTNEYSFEKNIVYPLSDTLRKNVLIRIKDREYAAINDYMYTYLSSNYVFTGHVYLLVDGGTFSAASVFAANLKAQREVTILGDETGGGEFGNDGRGFSWVKFPNTGLLLRLPQFWMQTTTHNKNTGHGVMPDTTIIPSIDDQVNGRDVVLDKTLHLIIDKK